MNLRTKKVPSGWHRIRDRGNHSKIISLKTPALSSNKPYPIDKKRVQGFPALFRGYCPDLLRCHGASLHCQLSRGTGAGSDPIAFQALLAGSIGAIWGAANAMPREAVMLYASVTEGKLADDGYPEGAVALQVEPEDVSVMDGAALWST